MLWNKSKNEPFMQGLLCPGFVQTVKGQQHVLSLPAKWFWTSVSSY